MEAAELAQLIATQVGALLAPIRDRLAKVEATQIQTEKSAAPSNAPLPSSPKADAAQAQPGALHGLCEDVACEACASQGQEIIDAAYAQGQHDALENLDQWLILAAGEDVRQRVIRLAARGQEIYQENQQTVKVFA